MSAFKGTPGPWSVGSEDADSGEIEVISEARPYVCMVLPGGIDDATAANARLIAAAPELLEALRRVLSSQTIKNPDPDSDPDVIFARDAIAKATGEQP